MVVVYLFDDVMLYGLPVFKFTMSLFIFVILIVSLSVADFFLVERNTCISEQLKSTRHVAKNERHILLKLSKQSLIRIYLKSKFAY